MDIDTISQWMRIETLEMGFKNNITKRHWKGRLLPTYNSTDRSCLLSNMSMTFVGFTHCTVCVWFRYPGFCLIQKWFGRGNSDWEFDELLAEHYSFFLLTWIIFTVDKIWSGMDVIGVLCLFLWLFGLVNRWFPSVPFMAPADCQVPAFEQELGSQGTPGIS